MPDDKTLNDIYDNEDSDDQQFNEDDATLGAALTQQMGATPWYVSSVALHCLAFLFLLIFAPEPHREDQTRFVINPEVIIEDDDVKDDKLDPDVPQEKDPDIEIESDIIVETPIITTSKIEISDHIETEDDVEMDTALGDPDQVSDADSEFSGTPAIMGPGKSGNKGGGGKFGFRNGGGKKGAIKRGGGGRPTEDALERALRWLAAHQEYDGHWDCLKYGGKGGDGGEAFKSQKGDVAVTSMALLAFLGAGNSTKYGTYRSNVAKAVAWLKTQQLASGQIGRHRYEGGIATMAICEAYGMSMNSDLRNVAQKAVDWACKSQCPSGGWDYAPANGGRVDTSVTGWWIMGLKSARVAGLTIPSETMDKALKYIQQCTTDSTGSTSYSSSTADVNQVKRGGGSIRMTAVGMTCLQFLGIDRKDAQVMACANRSVGDLPNPGKFDFYNWYYQALGLFQMGVRSQWWKAFNPAMKSGLLTTQVSEGRVEDNKGSWNPETDQYGAQWGRVGQTALGALMLEIYYRYKEVH